ncbi:MAG: hypothetical protein ACTS9Y_03900 [Methylophilus sp.]|uniref:hypothetical protein n=1 Tax=Methylophilus sp. TaxID=29541 RepID=UPI003FA1585C
MLKTVRVIFWVAVIATALMQVWDEYQGRQWQKPLHVALYPVNADASANVDAYMATLQEVDFKSLEQYFAREALRYQLSLHRPIVFHLGPGIKEIPLAPPALNANYLDIIFWSLKFRWFAWQHQPTLGVPIDIKLYLLYHDVKTHTRLLHSTALQKGRIGRVNLFAAPAQHAGNTVVIAHELLHTLGASDKYDLNTNAPMLPQGYAEPYMQPLYPQKKAEIMAGKIPLSANRARMARNLDETIIGRPTSREIGWAR